MSSTSRWDRDLPETSADIIALLERRIEVHRAWADFCRQRPGEAAPSVAAGVGTAESHERYIKQYEAAIRVIRCS